MSNESNYLREQEEEAKHIREVRKQLSKLMLDWAVYKNTDTRKAIYLYNEIRCISTYLQVLEIDEPVADIEEHKVWK